VTWRPWAQGLLPDRGGISGIVSLPHLGESDLPHFHLEQDLILYLSLGVKNGSLSGRQIGRCISEEKTQLQGPESQGRWRVRKCRRLSEVRPFRLRQWQSSWTGASESHSRQGAGTRESSRAAERKEDSAV